MLENYQSPWMDEELVIMRDAVRKFLDKEFVPLAEKWDKQGIVDRDAWYKAGEAGILCASISEEYGGGGGDFRHEMVLIEEFNRANISGFGNGVHSGIVAHYIEKYGTQEQKAKWLPKMVSGEIVSAIAMSEPGTGSDLQAVKTSALADGDDYVLNGQKTFITNGMTANLICVVAKTDPGEGAKGISLIMVETEAVEGEGGFQRGRNLEKLGMKAQDTAELFFDDVRIPVANRMGEEGEAFRYLSSNLAQERLSIAITGVASAQAALNSTVEYVKERTAFGKSLGEFQNTKFVLAEVKTAIEVAQAYVDQSVMKLIAGELTPTEAAQAKYWCTDLQHDAAHRCLQLFGGYGYTLEYPIARNYADARVTSICGGTNEIMKTIISKSLGL